MQEIKTNKRTIGVNIEEDGQAAICVWAPFATTVSLVLSTEQLPLEKKMYGYWQLTTNCLEEGTQYTIAIDDAPYPLPDPASLLQPDGVHRHSKVVYLKTFPWQDEGWKNIPLQDYLIYEIHTGTFSEEGTFAGIENKLDYLIELGISAIEIMPIAQFPGNRNWGYDGVFPFAVQDSYGGAKGLQQLVNSCHKKGLAVIVDVVYNHLGPEGNYLGSFGPYFTSKYKTPWGQAINFDDAYCDGVRRYFIENVLMWCRVFHIDALRLDAVHAIKDFSPVHILQEIKMYVDILMKETGRTYYLIPELDLNDTRYIKPIAKGGYGMDAQWADEFHHALRVTAGGVRTGYYSDFTGIEHLAKAYQDAYVYNGQYSVHRKKFFGVKTDEEEGKQFIVFSQNHDQVGNRMLGERNSSLFSFSMQKLLVGAVMVSPFLPMIFMGEEWSESNPFLYFVSHTDEALCAAVRKGRKEEFAAFHIEGQALDPIAEETFHRSKLQWALQEQGQHKVMLAYYKELIRQRKQQAALRNLTRKNVDVTCDVDTKTLILHRWHEKENIFCFMNFSKEKQPMPFVAGNYKPLLDSAHKQWMGEEACYVSATKILLQPESLLILSDHY